MPKYEDPWKDGLPSGDSNYLRKLVQDYKKRGDHIPDLETFFSMALLPFYDVMWTGLKRDVGHVIYRLSDFVPEEERCQIGIYPSRTGSIIDGKYGLWNSLVDWRRQWERQHLYIPEFVKLLPEAQDILQS